METNTVKMKTNIIYLLIAACIALILSSCSVTKDNVKFENVTTSENKDFLDPTTEDLEKSENKFVIYNDGTVAKFSKLKLVTKMFSTPYLLADGNIKIQPNDIKAYKDAKYYAISQKDFYTETQGHVATHVLPGFAIRVKKGDLNVYTLQLYDGGNVYKKYFLQNGATGKILPFSADLFNDYAKENESIVKALKSKKKKNPKNLLELVDNFNNSMSITTR